VDGVAYRILPIISCGVMSTISIACVLIEFVRAVQYKGVKRGLAE
jgi:hypothetical protein